MSWIRRETEKGTVQYICPRCHDYHEFREDFGERTFSENYIFCRRCGARNGTGNAPTLTPPNEWVSVENALPPEHEPVLCIVSGKPNPNITLEDAYQLGSWNKADGWIIDEWLDWEGANVTWWMKLPVPPDRRPPEGEANETK